MNGVISKKYRKPSIVSLFILSLAFMRPTIAFAEEYPLDIDFSPKIINVSSNRIGDIRVFTHFSYSVFVANGDSAFIYFNGSDVSIQNIQITRDSQGHLILRFTLDDFLGIESDLLINGFNIADTVLVMNNGDEYIGSDSDVFIVDKIAP
jgi:hypothetical protein